MKSFSRRAALAFFTVTIASAALAHSGVKSAEVMARMESMLSSKKAIERLVAMVDGSAPFDRASAKIARDALIQNTKATPRLFRDPHRDAKSEALPLIWQDWAGFESKNREALRAARALNVKTRAKLQPTLLALGTKCVACHDHYRDIRH